MPSVSYNARQLATAAIIYAVVSSLWVLIAIFVGGLNNGLLIGLAGVLILALLAAAILRLRKPTDTPGAVEDAAELGKWVGGIFAAEGIAIGVGSGILVALGLEFWIAPWVAVVVGLHFFPLGKLFGLPLDYVLGAAIIIWVIVVVLTVPEDGRVVPISLGKAFLLWLAGWGRLYVAGRG